MLEHVEVKVVLLKDLDSHALFVVLFSLGQVVYEILYLFMNENGSSFGLFNNWGHKEEMLNFGS